MSAKLEYKGKDVDEAIRMACEGLGVDRDQLDIEVKATGSSGIFGLCRKKAVVLVRIKAAEAAEAAVSSAGAPRRGAGRTRVQPPKGPGDQRRPRGGAAEPLEEETVAAIRDDLKQLLELMGCPSEVTVSPDQENKLEARIDGPHVETVIGPEGQTLDSLQYLMRKMVGKKIAEKVMLTLDAGDFRATRAKELEEKALRLAREVKETGKTRSIPAMNPAERRIVHMALQDDTGIRSRSVGDGLFKKVLIYLPGKGRKGPSRKRKNSSA